MKAIILAAGEGKRLRPLTNKKPKCMVEVNGKSIISHQIECLRSNGIENINICLGYASKEVRFDNVIYHYNTNYARTNMVYTLFCAKSELENDDILVSYGDIIYNNDVLKAIMKDDSKIGVVVDRNWLEYWNARMENPLDDAETLKINDKGYIVELGKKPINYGEIQGQYIGLIKFRIDIISKIKDYYNSLDKNKLYDGNDFDNMYMTSFLQLISRDIAPLSPVFIDNGWIEVDTPSDLKLTKFINNN